MVNQRAANDWQMLTNSSFDRIGLGSVDPVNVRIRHDTYRIESYRIVALSIALVLNLRLPRYHKRALYLRKI